MMFSDNKVILIIKPPTDTAIHTSQEIYDGGDKNSSLILLIIWQAIGADVSCAGRLWQIGANADERLHAHQGAPLDPWRKRGDQKQAIAALAVGATRRSMHSLLRRL